MYIEPNTDIVILRRCPLDTTYNHTIYFESKNEQHDYFYGLKKYHLHENTYQRVQKGVTRVGIKADNLYDCNYLMFRNTSFGDKWFYAFITGVEYVNNVTSDITYEIDVMQTWYFDYDLKECFVEREHSLTDNIGDNTYPESIETGEYVVQQRASLTTLNDSVIIVASTFDKSLNPVGGASYNGLYSGVFYNQFDCDNDGMLACRNFIERAVANNKADGIVGLFQIPKFLCNYEHDDASIKSGFAKKRVSLNKSLDSINGYVPRNKKLFVYPYNILYCTNNQGVTAVYRFEDFHSETCDFCLTGNESTNASVYLVPLKYKNKTSNNESTYFDEDWNFDEKICISGFPVLAYNVDTWKAWCAQNLNLWSLSNELATKEAWTNIGLSSAIGTIGALSGSVYGTDTGISGAVHSSLSYEKKIKTAIAEIEVKETMPRQAKNSGTPNALSAIQRLTFEFYYKQIKPEYARIVDEYFDVFGYATHRVKKPNIGTRPHWNYVKTIGCVAVGSVPSDDLKKICSIYDNGITFWKNGNNIGRYSELDNTV